jgi:hypothetical protein
MPDSAVGLDPDTFATAERTFIRERVIVSPVSGRFVPLPPESLMTEGEWVEAGEPVADVRQGDSTFEVRSPFRGWLMGMLALPSQPVREGEALFWVWGC